MSRAICFVSLLVNTVRLCVACLTDPVEPHVSGVEIVDNVAVQTDEQDQGQEEYLHCYSTEVDLAREWVKQAGAKCGSILNYLTMEY